MGFADCSDRGFDGLSRRRRRLAAECGGDFEAWKKGFEAEAGREGIGPKGQQALDDARDRSERC